MTKAELIDQMAQDADISKKAAAEALKSLTGSIAAALKKKDGKVTLTGFGTFSKNPSQSPQWKKPPNRRNH